MTLYNFSVNLERGLLAGNDEFGDFAAFRSVSPPQSHEKDDSFFTAFESNTVMQPQQVKFRFTELVLAGICDSPSL